MDYLYNYFGDFMNLQRSELLIGKESVDKLKNTHVLIVGLGGVGGSCLEMIARSGIENISIMDYDNFEESNINRQVLCTIKNINKSKVDEAEKRVKIINPSCSVIMSNVKLDSSFFKNNKLDVNYIIDAIDDVKAKIELIKYAIDNNIKIISCMGTGNKLNPSKLEITDIWKTKYDPLAKKIRNILRKKKINYKLPVVSSSEEVIVKSVKEIPSLALVPNAAGIMLASYVINDVINNENSI